jgi:hypothetical protein
MQKIPITLGVVGHRDIVFTAEHRRVIENILNAIHTRYPHSPVVLFSQLATGADTEVAKVFLEVKEKTGRDYRLYVPLPFDKAYYEKNQFADSEELETFRQLLQKAERHFVLHKLSNNAKKILDTNATAYPEEIDALFRNGGEFIADSSPVLIALWDLVDNHLQGGTANTVYYKKHGSYKKYISEHIFDKEGNLIVVPCNRKNQNKALSFEKSTLETLLKDTSIKKALDKIEELNTDLQKIDKEKFYHNAGYLFPDNIALDDNARKLKSFFALADTLAIDNQKKYTNLLRFFFVLGFVIFGVFEAYKHLGLENVLFGFTIGLIVFAFSIFHFSFNWKNHKKYIENRVLAEALRVQFFWYLSRIRESVSNYILRIHKKEYHWISHILSSVYGLTFDLDSPAVPLPEIKENWIEDQKAYFKRNIEKLEKKERQHKIISYLTFTLGVVLLFGVYFLNKKEEWHHYLHGLIVLDSIVFGIFALIKAYYEKRGYEQIKTQYELMRDIYTASSKKLNELDKIKPVNKDKIKNILLLTGKEAVVENGNWYMIYKDKKPEVEGIG